MSPHYFDGNSNFFSQHLTTVARKEEEGVGHGGAIVRKIIASPVPCACAGG